MFRLMTVQEVADLLRVSNQTIINLAHQKKIPSIRVGHQFRFKERDVMEYLEKGGNPDNEHPQPTTGIS